LNKFFAIRWATIVNGGSGFPTAIVGVVGDCNVLTWASIAERGSIEMPSVIEGLGSISEVAWALPFTANIADGFALERLLC